jgi:hypothetical protein
LTKLRGRTLNILLRGPSLPTCRLTRARSCTLFNHFCLTGTPCRVIASISSSNRKSATANVYPFLLTPARLADQRAFRDDRGSARGGRQREFRAGQDDNHPVSPDVDPDVVHHLADRARQALANQETIGRVTVSPPPPAEPWDCLSFP